MLDDSVFSCRIQSLEDQQDRPAVLRIQLVLKFLCALLAAQQCFFTKFFRFPFARICRIEMFKAEMLSTFNPVVFCQFFHFFLHSCPLLFRARSSPSIPMPRFAVPQSSFASLMKRFILFKRLTMQARRRAYP